MSRSAAARVQRVSAKRGGVRKGGFAARAQRAAAKNSKK